LTGLVYTSLLFMVVPLVSSLESLDNSLIEAAYDSAQAARHLADICSNPPRRAGINGGCIVVFISPWATI